MKIRIGFFLLVLLKINIVFGQDIYYVRAKNGLNVRKTPDLQGEKIGKLPNKTQVKITFNPGIQLTIQDDGKTIHGQWVKILAHISPSQRINGYVFDGFLSEQKPKEYLEVKFKDFVVIFEHNGIWHPEDILRRHPDTVKIDMELGETPENKIFRIQHQYKNIEVFQRIENSVTVTNEGPHCDLINWKHYRSEWYKVPSEDKIYQTLGLIEKEGQHFIPIDLDKLKIEIKRVCGDRWYNLIKDKKYIDEHDFHMGTSTSKILLLFILTDKNGVKTNKVIEFLVPMGC